MPNTYTQLYIQIVFAVQNRAALIHEPIREEIQKYLTGIVKNNQHKMLAVFCMPDHAHVFVGLNPNQSISSLANDLKSNSSRWINSEKLCRYHFNWQNGYGAFSYHKGMLSTICNYINTQKEHHQRRSFKDEYLDLLHEFDVDFNEQYLFEFFE
ncbi:MAG: IS200/IS605 family transposase [Saprospiraceae bacterium]|nr:IS200/IS605 family transposase [Candidatus Opimibacter skivensis]